MVLGAGLRRRPARRPPLGSCLVCYLRDGDRVFETYWTTGRGNEVMGNSLLMLDRTVYGRQEPWEDSPPGWPQQFQVDGSNTRTNGRPAAQWLAPRSRTLRQVELKTEGRQEQ